MPRKLLQLRRLVQRKAIRPKVSLSVPNFISMYCETNNQMNLNCTFILLEFLECRKPFRIKGSYINKNSCYGEGATNNIKFRYEILIRQLPLEQARI